jgi:hypothetical protein
MNKSRWVKWATHVAPLEGKRNACKIQTGTPEEKRPLGRLKRRWQDNITIDFR